MLWVRCSFVHLKYSLRKEKADSGYPLPANGQQIFTLTWITAHRRNPQMLWVRCSFVHLKYSLRKEKADSGYPLPANGRGEQFRTL